MISKSDNYILSTIKNLCSQMNWTTYKLSIKSGIPYSSLNTMFKNNAEPKMSTLYKICGALNISLSEFFNDVPLSVIHLDEKQKYLIEQYNRLPPHKKIRIEAYIQGLVDEEKYNK